MAPKVMLTLVFLAIQMLLASSLPTHPNFPIAMPNCSDHCGSISVPFPFGTTKGCYLNKSFFIRCNESAHPPRAFLGNSTIEVVSIALEGQLRILHYVARDCYDSNGTRVSYRDPWVKVPIYLMINNTANKFTVVGCDTYAFVYGNRLERKYETGCTAMCDTKDDLVNGSCSGLGCCQTAIPKDVWGVNFTLRSYNNYTYLSGFENCSYAFLVEESAFRFSPGNLTSLKNVDRLPLVADWAIGNETCEHAAKNLTSYACKSVNSKCYKPNNGYGYRCICKDGYRGNPYLDNGCEDVDECQDPHLNKCEKRCVNKPGGYDCVCPKGYSGDGRKDDRGCIRGQSLVLKLVTGISIGVTVLILSTCWLYFELKRRKLIKMKQKFFLRNGGIMLQEKLKRKEGTEGAKIFTSAELKKATNDFHDSRIIGRGGFGTVYKGFLPDNRIVAIKRSREVDPSQIEQFVNEVVVLTQINHRNVVRLLGCCLETPMPLLVYEFISNGTISDHIHDKVKARAFSWDVRSRVATEAAGVLAYLHSAASPPIIHRDIKSANILLDDNFTAKVSDFGASRLVPLDQTQLSTMVQGTFGYLDPEYMQTNQLTEKSDVYSFGVVLVELLTGRKALSYDMPEEEMNLAYYFLSVMKQDCLFQILDNNLLSEGNNDQLTEVAKLAKSCLNVKGGDRPSMKEVAMALEHLRQGGKHSWERTEKNVEETEYLFGDNWSSFSIGDSSIKSVEYSSMKDHIILPLDGGR